jgi:hypothetical protein
MHSRCTIIALALAVVAGLGCSSSGSQAAQPAETIEQGNERTWYRGPDIDIEVDHWWAQRNFGEELMLLEVAFSAGQRPSLVKLENIRLISPDGHQVPPFDQTEFRRVYGELRMALNQTDAWRRPTSRIVTSRRSCDRWFIAPPTAREARFSEILAAPSEVCFGPLVFRVPAGIQPGPWVLTIQFEESRAKVPFMLEPTED